MKSRKLRQRQKSKNIITITIGFLAVFLIIFGFISLIRLSQGITYEWYIEEMHIDEVWDEYLGENVTIAFLDSGLSDDYMSVLGERIVNPYNVITKTNNVTDYFGHGTSMIITAAGDYESCGIYGIAPKSKIMPIVVTDEEGFTSGNNLSLGIIYAVENGADIISISLGASIEDIDVKNSIEFALEHETIVVASVGDYNIESVLYPAKYAGVMAIQAQSKLGSKYLYASWGDEIDFMIPGEQIKTVDITFGDYNISNGSSISTAIMSGVLALILEKNNDFDYINTFLGSYEYEDTFININDMILKIEKGD